MKLFFLPNKTQPSEAQAGQFDVQQGSWQRHAATEYHRVRGTRRVRMLRRAKAANETNNPNATTTLRKLLPKSKTELHEQSTCDDRHYPDTCLYLTGRQFDPFGVATPVGVPKDTLELLHHGEYYTLQYHSTLSILFGCFKSFDLVCATTLCTNTYCGLQSYESDDNEAKIALR